MTSGGCEERRGQAERAQDGLARARRLARAQGLDQVVGEDDLPERRDHDERDRQLGQRVVLAGSTA